MSPEVIGIIPAAGHATRLAPLPCSKELFPIGFRSVDKGANLRPKVVCQDLLDKLERAGVRKTYIVLRKGKWDIPGYFACSPMHEMHLAYVVISESPSAAHSVDQAYPFMQDAIAAFGFPDILFEPDDAFSRLLRRQAMTGADVVLGLFPAHAPHKLDMVDVDESGRVCSLMIRPRESDLRYAWMIAVWTPVFTRFLHEYLVQQHRSNDALNPHLQRELFVGDVIQGAVSDRLLVQAELFPDGSYLDIGTPDDLVEAVRRGAVIK